VRRVHTFRLPPGLLGGLYSASFSDVSGAVHRCVLSYRDAALLPWELRPLEEALRVLAVVEVEGRVEVGKHTGHVLHYFLSGAEEGETPARAEKRRQASLAAWLRACRGGAGAPALRLAGTGNGGAVLCATTEAGHLLLRVEPRGDGSAGSMAAALGAAPPGSFAAGDPLARDILGEWRER
jgi:hypothetical protein